MKNLSSNNPFLDFYKWYDAPFHKFFNLLENLSFGEPDFNMFRGNASLFTLRKAMASFCILGILLINIPIFNAYEAHVLGATAHIKNPIASHLVINKVYYDVDANHGTEEENEWVELYNPTNETINISGWEICDDEICVVLSSEDLNISPKSFALVSRSAATWNYWHIPSETIKIVLANPSLFYLNNLGDMLSLKNSAGVIIDQMNWGIPDESWVNYNNDLWNPGCSITPEGYMLGRFPNGYDTNQPSDFKEFALPEVSVIYPSGGSLYCNQNINIQWQAINPNGSDSDLSIDIVYTTDNDNSGTISSGDSVYLIADNIGNTGIFNWTLSPCYYGWVWIEVIATGPENIMINNSAVGIKVFEPPMPCENSAACGIPAEDISEDSGEQEDSLEEDLILSLPIEPVEPIEPIDLEPEEILEDGNNSEEQNPEEEISEDEEISETELIAPDNLPEAPKGLAVEYKEGGVVLQWEANGERDLAGYNIYRKQSGGSYEKINSSLIKLFSFFPLIPAAILKSIIFIELNGKVTPA